MIHTVVSLIVCVGQATETGNYFNFLLKCVLKIFGQFSFSGEESFYVNSLPDGRQACG
jgi:hypothetical protein